MLTKTALSDRSGGFARTALCLSRHTGCLLCPAPHRSGGFGRGPEGIRGWAPLGLIFEETGHKFLVSLGQTIPFDGFFPGRYGCRDDYRVRHSNSIVPLF